SKSISHQIVAAARACAASSPARSGSVLTTNLLLLLALSRGGGACFHVLPPSVGAEKGENKEGGGRHVAGGTAPASTRAAQTLRRASELPLSFCAPVGHMYSTFVAVSTSRRAAWGAEDVRYISVLVFILKIG
ncbi:hypothetical protein B0H13DRAFT_2116399, partial [Mycena leptocephala]